MDKFTCEKCQKGFTKKSQYERHMNRKTSCAPKNIVLEIEDTDENDIEIYESLSLFEKLTMNEKPIIEEIKETKEIKEIEKTTLNVDLSNYKYIDLFCGVGGFHQALSKMGATCVLACDIDKDCRQVYKDNYGIEPVKDIKDIDEKKMVDFDILCGGFPCFVAGTQTLTHNGYKNIEDVLLTDKLLTHTGKFQNIVNLQKKIYVGDVYDIKVKYHSQLITATEEHPFYVREQKKVWNSLLKKYDYMYGDPEWKIASKLNMNDYFGMVINTEEDIPQYVDNNNILFCLDEPEHWFTMGYFVGDGICIKDNAKKGSSNSFDFDCHLFNDYSISMVAKVFEVKSKKITELTSRYGYSDEILPKEFWLKLFKNFDENGEKIIPEWVHNAPKKLIQKFIDGYMAAYNYDVNNVLRVTTTSSLRFAYGIQRLYLKLGNIAEITKKSSLFTGNMYEIFVNIKKNPKESSSFIDGNYVWYAPFKITKRETTQISVYNFEVETDNSYVVENVCVHNCQPFSNGGKKHAFGDNRGLLFDEIMRLAKEKKPKFMFLENVKHILKVSNGQVIEYIKKRIADNGYHLQIFQISPHNYGIPQQRERVYFVCVRNDMYNGNQIVLPTYDGKIEFEKYLDKKESIDKKYFIKDDILDVLNAWDLMVKKFEVGEKISPTIMIHDAYREYTDTEFNDFPDWKKEYITKNKPLIEKYKENFDEWYKEYKDTLLKREIYGKLEWQTGPIKNNDSIFNHFIQLRQSGIRVKKSEYFPTLVAISQIPIYGKEKRYITPRECARLQSFPETFKLPKDDKKSYKQMGNSVNVDNVFTVISSTLKNYM